MQDVSKVFMVIHDPRVDRTKKHSLCKIITLAIYAILAGADTWEDIEDICELRKEDLEKIMELENSIPSHDTFQRVFAMLDPKELSDAIAVWMESLVASISQKHIALDGKTLRRSFDRANKKSAIHTLNAFVVDSMTILRHEVGSNKDSEISMIEDILKKIDIKNSIITIDAIGCQKKFAKEIRKRKGDYLFALKGNQPTLEREVQGYFEYAEKNSLDEETYNITQTIDKGHGRIENRSYFCLDTKYFPLEKGSEFEDINTIVRVNRVREKQGEQTNETSYYISSLPCDSKKIGSVIRGHWAIENSLHYVLDVVYHEDGDRTRKDHSPANLSLLRKVAISLINKNKPPKTTQRSIRRRAMMNHSYAIFLLLGQEVNGI